MDQYAMDGHKLYWHLDRVLDWQRGKTVMPIYIEISPISYCNHDCIFCGIDFARQERKSLDPDILCDRLKEMGQLGIRSVMFAGEGEPLLYKDIAKIVNTAHASGIDVSITTNGMSGNESIWRELIPHLTWLRFSIDAGSSAVYAKVHRIAESCFDRTIESLKKAIQTKDKLRSSATIGVQFLLIEENMEDIGVACELFSKIGVDYLSFKPYSEHPLMQRKSGFNYSNDIIAKINEIVESHKGKSKTRIIFRKHATDHYSSGDNSFSHCQALPFWGYISTSGDFNTCSVFINDPRFQAGNIHSQSMREILFGHCRHASINFAAQEMSIASECRRNCRMARVNEFLTTVKCKPAHINFI